MGGERPGIGRVRPQHAPWLLGGADPDADPADDAVIDEQFGTIDAALAAAVLEEERLLASKRLADERLGARRNRRRADQPVPPADARPEQRLAGGAALEDGRAFDREPLDEGVRRLVQQRLEIVRLERSLSEVGDDLLSPRLRADVGTARRGRLHSRLR
ncbi:hypothetical protein GWG54_01040 [Natronococcus sp. JC468]|nr:hypothetical protein [Natronococcus sp. JC468]